MDNTLFNLEGTQYTKVNGGIAQLGERLPCKQEVNGSIPFISTIQYGILKKLRFFLQTEPNEVGLAGKRRDNGVRELSPQEEAEDTEFVSTRAHSSAG